MLYKYEIKNNGTEDILYLYLDFRSEFSRELTTSSSQEEITRRTKNFIVNNHIKFYGSKVFLIIDGIVVKTVNIDSVKETIKSSPNYSNEKFLIHLKLEDNAIIEVTLKDYLLGTMASIYNGNIMDETLKCIAILYRTYAYKMMYKDKVIDNSNTFLKYRHISMFKLSWISDYQGIVDRLSKAIEETDCIFLSYNNDYILPFIHICNNGKTFSNPKYPYLTSVSSLWDLACPNSKEIMDLDYKSFSNILDVEINHTSKIAITKLDKDNCVLNLSINNKVFTGEEFKNKLFLNSLNFNIILYHNYVRIITFGFGNGLGLSIYGANELSQDGVDYPDILKYYFPKTNINKYIKELS